MFIFHKLFKGDKLFVVELPGDTLLGNKPPGDGDTSMATNPPTLYPISYMSLASISYNPTSHSSLSYSPTYCTRTIASIPQRLHPLLPQTTTTEAQVCLQCINLQCPAYLYPAFLSTMPWQGIQRHLLHRRSRVLVGLLCSRASAHRGSELLFIRIKSVDSTTAEQKKMYENIL